MEKIQRKICFCTAAEGEQELYTQQELLAPCSWSSEDHSGEAEQGLGSLMGWAAPGIWPQQHHLQKKLMKRKRLCYKLHSRRNLGWRGHTEGKTWAGCTIMRGTRRALLLTSLALSQIPLGSGSEGLIYPVGQHNTGWHHPRCRRGDRNQEKQKNLVG